MQGRSGPRDSRQFMGIARSGLAGGHCVRMLATSSGRMFVGESAGQHTGRGQVLGIAVRPAPGTAMREVQKASAPADGWLEGDHGGSAKRGITFLDRDLWDRVCAGLGTALPWHPRRANVCVEGLDLMALLGRRVRVGDLEVEMLAENRPCGLMDEFHPGLLEALDPAGYAGVYGRVREGGAVRIGDAVEVVDDTTK